MDIEEIVRRAADGDEQAWNVLVRQYGRLLRSLAAGMRMRPWDGEDAAQQTWLALRRSIHRLHTPEHVRAWLCRVMRRNCVRVLKARRGEWLADDVEAWQGGVDAVEPVTRAETAAVLWATVDRLPDRERQLLRALFDREERSYREIARDLRMPVGSVGPVRMRALGRLTAMLEAAGVTIDDLHAVA